MSEPRTITHELREDTTKQLIKALEAGGFRKDDIIVARNRRKTIANRLRGNLNGPSAIALCGLPGAGKSKVAEKLADVYDTSVLAMGDVIRDEYMRRNGNVHNSKELAEFAAKVRYEDAEQIPKWVTKASEDVLGKTEDDLIIIDGVRSVTDYEVLNDYYDDFYLVHVTAPFYTRLSRLVKRARENEETFGPVELAERDEGELDDLGFRKLRDSENIDIEVDNSEGWKTLTINLSSLCENDLPFKIANGKPLGLDDQLEEMRKSKARGGVVGD